MVLIIYPIFLHCSVKDIYYLSLRRIKLTFICLLWFQCFSSYFWQLLYFYKRNSFLTIITLLIQDVCYKLRSSRSNGYKNLQPIDCGAWILSRVRMYALEWSSTHKSFTKKPETKKQSTRRNFVEKVLAGFQFIFIQEYITYPTFPIFLEVDVHLFIIFSALQYDITRIRLHYRRSERTIANWFHIPEFL